MPFDVKQALLGVTLYMKPFSKWFVFIIFLHALTLITNDFTDNKVYVWYKGVLVDNLHNNIYFVGPNSKKNNLHKKNILGVINHCLNIL